MACFHSIKAIVSRELGLIRKHPVCVSATIGTMTFCMIFFLTFFIEGMPHDLPIGVVDSDRSSLSRNIVRQIDATQIGKTVSFDSYRQAREALQKGEINGFCVIPPGMYNDVLSGTDGSILYSSDIVGNLTDGTDIVYREAVDGDGIMLTIDIDIQLVAEQAVRRVCLSSGAESASCIVLDPNSFEVLVMVNYPSYDLNDIPRDEPEVLNSLSRNTIVCDIYEPGSTFKVVTAAANLQEYLNGNTAAFSPTYIFNGSRTRSVDGTTIRCWSDHANGKHSSQTLALALNNSCNPCFTDIALALGTDVFYDYLTLFGLGNVTGIDFAGEALGMLVPQSLVRDCDLARIGFGQTVAVTGLQLACAVASAVNGGNYYVPSLARGVVSKDGSVEELSPVLKNTTISERASAMLCEMLEAKAAERTPISKATAWRARRARRKSTKTAQWRRASMCRRLSGFFLQTSRAILRSS